MPALAGPVQHFGPSSCSIGSAIFPEHGKDAVQLLHHGRRDWVDSPVAVR
ncbi:MAG TPA: hypothetical protein VN259_17505 [Xanthomonadales bacterium]|nr:hypothetical protein [Xanthomonadales bacterium]